MLNVCVTKWLTTRHTCCKLLRRLNVARVINIYTSSDGSNYNIVLLMYY